MIKDCSTKYGSVYSLFTRGDDPDIIAIENHYGAIFLIDTESRIPLCQMLHPDAIQYTTLDPICATDVKGIYLDALVLAEDLLVDESPLYKA